METPVFLWDEKILQCADCKTQEGGIAARMRRYRHPRDRGRYYADCAECGGANLPIPDSPSEHRITPLVLANTQDQTRPPNT